MIELAPNARGGGPSRSSGSRSRHSALRLVWSQPTRRGQERPRNFLLLSVLCFFSGGVIVGTSDFSRLPPLFRAPLAVLMGAGAFFLVLGLALLLLQKGRRARGGRLSTAGFSRVHSERLRQEERP